MGKEGHFDSTPTPHAPIELRAGPLHLTFDAGNLLYVKLGDHEVIRRIYAAVRDRHWDTVPGELSKLKIRSSDDSFEITYTCAHRQREICFVWEAEITGDASGRIRFKFDGEAQTTFFRNRIGICVLHPDSCAGRRCRVHRADGSHQELVFPKFIEPSQPMPGILDLKSFAHEVVPEANVWAELLFAGDLFEMEDQRNWLDASFKTFSTPLRLPYPVEVKAGERVHQEIVLQITENRIQVENESAADAPLHISLDTTRHPIPSIGLGMATHEADLTTREITHLKRLQLGHLRADVRLGSSEWCDTLDRAQRLAAGLELPLELAVHLPKNGGDAELDALVGQLRAGHVRVKHVLLFRDGEKTLSTSSLRMAHPYLSPLECLVGAGTDANFCELNQFRPPHNEADFIYWPMNPQVHAFDLASIAETPSAVASQVASATAYFPGKPLIVSPITLKQRFNPVAGGSQPAPSPDELPPQVDSRQPSPFAAAWTLAVIKYLAESGVQSMTFFETTGWRGVMELEIGPPLPELFPSKPGQVFPLYYAVAAASLSNYDEVITTHSTSPLRVESLALRKGGSTCIWLVNLTGEPQKALVSGSMQVSRKHSIDWSMEDRWMFDPESVLQDRGQELSPPQNEITVELPPFGFVRLEGKA